MQVKRFQQVIYISRGDGGVTLVAEHIWSGELDILVAYSTTYDRNYVQLHIAKGKEETGHNISFRLPDLRIEL
ncbi:MAG: hypothetical protein E7304_11135 [Butyrivibrio sp.]|uniref:hypothetical protein n=1 Tax=Butyrivibrio sp. TaxID=28121 RepID=UPI001EC97C9D|nr:hypothetical protein [Butyrivibrio sp.]MBE5841942.1 hypothetical protein [Butyrivibrio sp.]